MQNVNNDIYSKFYCQVLTQKKSIAIDSNDGSITYEDLDKKISMISNYLLQNEEIKVETGVGVMLPRSIDFIACILSILKIGSIYLPIDPDLPKVRRNFILNNSNTKLLIDSNTQFGSNYTTHVSSAKIHPDNIAYIMYTSGSTGMPKPVALTHRGVLNLIEQNKLEGIKKVCGNANFCFDISIFEILFPLLTGATLVLLDKEQITTRDMFETNTKDIDVILLTFSIFESLVNEQCNFDHIKYLFVGGEKFKPEVLPRLYNPPKYLINSYGPTENTVISFNHKVKKHDKEISLGKPIRGTMAFITDENLEKATRGEILVGGKNLARGYFNNPSLTAEKFIANPFGNGDRLYKTGDFGYFLKDRTIAFIGREDEQVKIRGYRIELTEIEKCIENYPGVKNCVVLVNKVENADILSAYVVSNLSESEILDKLSKDIPGYMIPNEFIFVQGIPLNDNGKIDKKQLRKLNYKFSTFNAPTNLEEATICNIFEEVINKKKISIDDDFFKIGGDSILAIQLVSRAKKSNILFTLKDVFDLKTVRNISNKVRQNINIIPPEKKLRFGTFSLTPWQCFLDKNKINMRYVIHECNSETDITLLRNNLNKLNFFHKEFKIEHSALGQKYFSENIVLKDIIINQEEYDFVKLCNNDPLQIFLVRHNDKQYILIAADPVILDSESFESLVNMLLHSKNIQKCYHSFAQYIDILHQQMGEEFIFDTNDDSQMLPMVSDFESLKIDEIFFDLDTIRSSNYFSLYEFFLAVLLMAFDKKELSFSFLKNIRNNFLNFDFKYTIGNFDHLFIGSRAENKANLSLMNRMVELLHIINRSTKHFSKTIKTDLDLFFSYERKTIKCNDDPLKNIAKINFVCFENDSSLDIVVNYNKKIYTKENIQTLLKSFISIGKELIENIDSEKAYVFNNLNVSEVLSIVKIEQPTKKLFFLPPISGHPFPYLVFSDNELFKQAKMEVCAIGDLEFGYNINDCSSLVGLSHKFAELIKENISQTDDLSFAGWCFGGYLALEISRQLLKYGYNITKTILIDSPDPKTMNDVSDCSDQEIRDHNKFFDENGILPGTFSERKTIDNLKKNNRISAMYSPNPVNYPIEMITTDFCHNTENINYWKTIAEKMNVYKTDLLHSEIFDDKNIPYITDLIIGIINT